MSATDVGVPLADACGGSLVRERASATPSRASAPKAAPAASSESAARPGKGSFSPPLEPLPLPLRDLEEWFAAAIMHPGGLSASLEDSAATRSAGLSLLLVERLVRPSAAMSGAERIEIYRQAYRSRLIECLADDYPAAQHALGEDDFEAACSAFIEQNPSRAPSLNYYGRPFATFLRDLRHPLSAFAADLAALEWALVEVIHAGSSSRLSHAALAAVPAASWAGARFVASSTVRLLELRYPANSYFQRFRQGEHPSPPAPAWSATAVFRDGATLWRMDLSRSMHRLLRELFAGQPLGQAVESLAGELAESEPSRAPRASGPTSRASTAGSDVMQWFRDWVHHGFFARIDVA